SGPGFWADASWDEAIAEAAVAFRESVKGGALIDAGLTLEEMFLVKALVGTKGAVRYASRVGADEDGFLIVNEKGANQRGAEMLGLSRAEAPAPAAILLVERGDNVGKPLRDGAQPVVVFATDSTDVP